MSAHTGDDSVAPTPTGQPTLADFILLNEEIAALVRARLPIESQLARLGRELPGKTGALAEQIGRRLEAGDSLPDAIDAVCASMPAAYRAAIVAGLESGQLGSALESLVESASRMEQLRRVTGVAVLYPLVIIVVVCQLTAFVLRKILPEFYRLDQQQFWPLTNSAVPPHVLADIVIVVQFLVVLFAVLWWVRSGRLGGATTSRFGALAWLPWVRRVYYWGQAATMADLLRMLVERGLAMDRALRLSADAAGNAKMRAAAADLAAEVERGEVVQRAQRVDSASGRSAIPLLIRLALRHGRDHRLLTSSLRHAAGIYRERAIRAAEWHAEYLPILLTIAIGGTLTLGFTVLILWPYASMLYEISSSNWG